MFIKYYRLIKSLESLTNFIKSNYLKNKWISLKKFFHFQKIHYAIYNANINLITKLKN